MQRYGPARMRTVGCWLGITEDQLAHIDHLKKLAQEIKSAGLDHCTLLGMGGSSLCPEVMKLTFGKVLVTQNCRFDRSCPDQLKPKLT